VIRMHTISDRMRGIFKRGCNIFDGMRDQQWRFKWCAILCITHVFLMVDPSAAPEADSKHE
jgi:hypothetical protein